MALLDGRGDCFRRAVAEDADRVDVAGEDVMDSEEPVRVAEGKGVAFQLKGESEIEPGGIPSDPEIGIGEHDSFIVPAGPGVCAEVEGDRLGCSAQLCG